MDVLCQACARPVELLYARRSTKLRGFWCASCAHYSPIEKKRESVRLAKPRLVELTDWHDEHFRRIWLSRGGHAFTLTVPQSKIIAGLWGERLAWLAHGRTEFPPRVHRDTLAGYV